MHVTSASGETTSARFEQSRAAWWDQEAAIAGEKSPRKGGGGRERGPAPWVGEGEWLNADARVAQVLKFERCEANVGASS